MLHAIIDRLARNGFVSDTFRFRAFVAELATVFCGLVSAGMPFQVRRALGVN